MRKIKAFFLLLAAVTAPFSPMAPSVSVREVHDYRETVHSVMVTNSPNYAVSASAEGVFHSVDGFETSGEVKLGGGTESVVFAFPKGFEAIEESDIRATLSSNGRTEVRFADLDDGGAATNRDGRIFTAPAVFPNARTVSYRVVTKNPLPKGVEIIATDVSSKSLRFQISSAPKAAAAVGGIGVVPRSEWGADEEFRYRDSATWKPIIEKLAKENEVEPSAAIKAYREKMARIESKLRHDFPDQYEAVEAVSEENGRPLVWPVQQTRKVEKVILHHTAENNLKDLDDASLLRSTYRYHAVTRGWGDIGYNYVVGQRGTIYEGRAGGDYAVWAHASWNNRSTVGVSVIGNFEVDNLNSDQLSGVKKILEALSEKYGIDFSKTSFAHRECPSSKNCDVESYSTQNLIGHKDVGYTACPGKNFYALLPALRKDASYSLGLKAVENPKYAAYLASKKTSATAAATVGKNLPKGPKVRILLSYPSQNSVTIEGRSKNPRFGNASISGTLAKNIPLKIEAVWNDGLRLVLSEKKVGSTIKTRSVKLGALAFFESDVLRVKNWDRKPSWDKSGTMNDNLFRGKIEIRNENGTIVLINELPLEDYLKGLAETSNGDHVEKMKTIIVAARSYAYFYVQKENRKFPGKPYDGSDDPDVFQKYLGYGYELRSPNAVRYVEETNGEMVSHDGKIIKPWYFSESDGRVRSYREYCQARVDNGTLSKTTKCEDVPYLMGAVDPGGVGKTLKGHGVGISGIGATYFATNLEWKYPQIIRYYLDGTEIQKVY